MLIIHITVTRLISLELLKHLIRLIRVLIKITVAMGSEFLCSYTKPIINFYAKYVYIDSSAIFASYRNLICACLLSANRAVHCGIAIRGKYHILTAKYNSDMGCREYGAVLYTQLELSVLRQFIQYCKTYLYLFCHEQIDNCSYDPSSDNRSCDPQGIQVIGPYIH